MKILGVGLNSASAFLFYTMIAVTRLPCRFTCYFFLDPEGGSQKSTLAVLFLVVVISSLKIPNTQRSATKLCIHMLTFPIDLPTQIFHLFSH